MRYLGLQKCLKVNGLYDSNYRDKLKELAKLEGMRDIIKDIKYLSGHNGKYVLSSITRYLRDENYDSQVLIKIIRDKLDLVNHMVSDLDACNGPDLEKLYANYDSDTYQLLVERFSKHYMRGESDEYSAIKYCNLLLGDNKKMLKYLTCYLTQDNIKDLLELKPEKLEMYLTFISIKESDSSIMKFIEMVDVLEKLSNVDFKYALNFVYGDTSMDFTDKRLDLLPLLINVNDRNGQKKATFDYNRAQIISRFPSDILIRLLESKEKETIVRGLTFSTINLLEESRKKTSPIYKDAIYEIIFYPNFYKMSDNQKYLLLDCIGKNGEELEEDVTRYQQKLDFILSTKQEELRKSPFLKNTLDFICQDDSDELFMEKIEAIESFNGDFQDENQYGHYLALLQAGTLDKTDKEKIKIISSRSRDLTENSVAEFYQRIESSPNKDRFVKLLGQNRDDTMFPSICDIISTEGLWNHPDTYTSILDYVDYIDKKEELLGVLKGMEEIIIKGKGEEEKQRMIDHLFENLKQTFTLGDYTIEILGKDSLEESLKQGDLVYESPNCKAQIKVKKSLDKLKKV